MPFLWTHYPLGMIDNSLLFLSALEIRNPLSWAKIRRPHHPLWTNADLSGRTGVRAC